MILLRILVKAGDQRPPHMSQIDAIARDGTRSIGAPIIGIRCHIRLRTAVGQEMLFGRETALQIAPVGKSIGDAPHRIRLAPVGKRFALQSMFGMPEHSVLKLYKLCLLFLLIVPQQRGLSIEIPSAAASPGTLGQREHVGIEVVLVEQLPCVVDIAVVPEGDDAACQVGTARRLVIDAAVEERHQVGIIVKMIGIMEAAVYCGDARLRLSPVAPQLSHVYLTRSVVPSRVPRDDLLAS